MGCLFSKKQQQVEIEINTEGTVALGTHPFNDKNDHKFLGYPKYAELTQFINVVLATSVSLWEQYREPLLQHSRKIDQYLDILNFMIEKLEEGQLELALELPEVPPDFNLLFGNYLIIDIQTGLFKTMPIDTSYFVNITLDGNKQEHFTSLLPAKQLIEWNEAFVIGIKSGAQQQFKIQLMSHNVNSSSIGNGVSFLFDELKDQNVHLKDIKVKGNNTSEIFGIIQMKCQLVFDLMQFSQRWRQELQYRREQIDRMISKMNVDPEQSEVMFQSLMSVSNRMGTETVYEIPYKIQ